MHGITNGPTDHSWDSVVVHW